MEECAATTLRAGEVESAIAALTAGLDLEISCLWAQLHISYAARERARRPCGRGGSRHRTQSNVAVPI